MLWTLWDRWTVVVLALSLSVAEARAGEWLFVSLLEAKKIVTFEREPGTGKLTRRHETDCPAEPACLSASPDRKSLLVSLRSTGQLASFRINPASGRLTLVSVVEGGADPAYLLPDHTGRFLLTAYYVANKVTVHRLARDGSISRSPVQTVNTAPRAHGIVLDTKNRFAFVPHTSPNQIYQFRFDQDTGRLTANTPPFVRTLAGTGPRHIALHPSDRFAYVSNEAGDSLSVFSLDRESGTLEPIQTLGTIPEEFDGAKNTTARCEITPDGRFVYVANRGHDSIAGYATNAETGRVTALGQTPTEKTPRSFTITPSGRFLYAAGQGSGRIAAFRIKPDGRLNRFATYDVGPIAWWALAINTPGS